MLKLVVRGANIYVILRGKFIIKRFTKQIPHELPIWQDINIDYLALWANVLLLK